MSISVDVIIGAHKSPGTLSIPDGAVGAIVFVHGSGSSRLSPRNREAAAKLQRRGFATLLFDLLSEAEAHDRRNVFDIPLLAQRVGEAIKWFRGDRRVAHLPIGLFGAGTGGGAAIRAAALSPYEVRAVVCRGGRPDLAGMDALARNRAATLLIVGGADRDVLALNEAALARMRCERRIAIVPGAGHLFEEPGALDAVVELAADWFAAHLKEADHAQT
jgi:putative phosphoribosyl transferase